MDTANLQKSPFIVQTGRDFKIVYRCGMNHFHSKNLPTQGIQDAEQHINTTPRNSQKLSELYSGKFNAISTEG